MAEKPIRQVPNLWCPYCHQFTVIWTPARSEGECSECKRHVSIDDYDDE